MDAEQLEEFANPLPKFVALQSVEPSEILNCLSWREPAIKSRGGGKEPDLRADLLRMPADVETSHLGRAVGRLENGGEETESGGLPCAIGAQQAIDLSGLAAESYAIDSAYFTAFAVVEHLGELDGFNHRVGRRL